MRANLIRLLLKISNMEYCTFNNGLLKDGEPLLFSTYNKIMAGNSGMLSVGEQKFRRVAFGTLPTPQRHPKVQGVAWNGLTKVTGPSGAEVTHLR